MMNKVASSDLNKREIRESLALMEADNYKMFSSFKKSARLDDYESYVFKDENGTKIWSVAFQKAIDENEIVFIPRAAEPYYADRTIIIPSNRIINADRDARIRQKDGVKVLMLRNANVSDGTHCPIDESKSDTDIMICGGIWEEYHTRRSGYGKSGMIDEERSFYGVYTCMFFCNVNRLCLKNMVFRHTGGFSVQCGYIKNAVFDNIKFEECFADGLHINGNSENIVVKNISGQVGDDLVALNMYDWQDSSVSFGPGKNILCENLELSHDSRYKAMRIEIGTYFFDNGESVDCSMDNLVVSGVRGIKTFKLYFQTPRYKLGESPEKGGVGSCGKLFFENIDIDLDGPIDAFSEYVNGDPFAEALPDLKWGQI